MTKRQRLSVAGALAAAAFLAVMPIGSAQQASEQIDTASIDKIKAEGMDKSQVMEIMSYLTDVYGPRLTGSPNILKAGEWAVAKMKSWGLTNVAMEPWADRRGFDRGWSNDKFYLAAVSPQYFAIPGTPTAWTPGTKGLVRGEVVMFNASTTEAAEPFKGKLRGKWIMSQGAPNVNAFWDPLAVRYTDEQLNGMQASILGTPPRGGGAGRGGRGGGAPAGGRGGRGGGAAAGGGTPLNRNEFLLAEGIAGVLSTATIGHGVYTIGGNRGSDPATTLTAVTIPAEQYGRIARMLEKNIAVTLEADIVNTYTDNPPMFNVVGEIRGTDKADEIVMLGGHFDSWHASTGATDNGAGTGAMMEAMRILKTTGVPLRRTVRIGLWPGEEQGLNGSREYVDMHFGATTCEPIPGAQPAQPAAGAGAGGRGGGTPGRTVLNKKADYDKFAGYFNIDNGTGAIRGVYLQGNEAVAPIFRQWMGPFTDLGMTHLTIANTGGTDHLSFDGIGLPGWQFIQDSIEYGRLTHHTNLDSYERLQEEDMRKNATIAAAFAFLAANRDEKLPGKVVAGGNCNAGGGRGRGGQ